MTELLHTRPDIVISQRSQRKMQIVNAGREARRYEKTEGLYAPDGLEGLPTDELLVLGMQVADARDVMEAYDLLANISSRGRSYYDETVGLQHERAHRVLDEVLSATERDISVGLDVPVGSGETSLVLGKHAQLLIGIDASQSMLGVAQKKLSTAGIHHQLYVGDATDMTAIIPDRSVDVITSHALQPYLTIEETKKLWKEFHRVLRPGGRMYSYRISRTGPPPEYHTSPRAELVGQIVETVLSFTHNEAHYKQNHSSERQQMSSEEFGFIQRRIPIRGGLNREEVQQLVKVTVL